MSRSRGLPVMALSGALLLWSTAFPLITVALESLEPLPLASVRLVVASLGFVPLVVVLRQRLPRGRDLARAAVSGVLLLGTYSAALNLGEARVSPALAGLLISTAPVFALLLEVRRGVSAARWAAVAVILAGCAIGALGAGLGGLDLLGVAWVLVAAAAEAVALVVAAPLVSVYSPVALTAVGVWASAIVLAPWAPAAVAQLRHAEPAPLAATLVLGVGPTMLAYLLLAVASRDLSPLLVTGSFALLPALTAFASLVVVGTPLNAALLLGALVTAAGIGALARLEAPPTAASL